MLWLVNITHVEIIEMGGMTVQSIKQHLKRKETCYRIYLFIYHSRFGKLSEVLQFSLLANLPFTLICRRRKNTHNYRLLEWALSGTWKNPNSRVLSFYLILVKQSHPKSLVCLCWIFIEETFEAWFQRSCLYILTSGSAFTTLQCHPSWCICIKSEHVSSFLTDGSE